MWQTRSMSVWSNYFDTGRAFISIPSKNGAVFTITNFPDIGMAHVKSVQGWNEQFLIICKYVNVKSEVRKCQYYGDPLTELVFTFETK